MTIMRKKYVGAGFTSVLLALCLLAIFTVIITACSTSSSNEPNPVKLEATTFSPPSITIKKGEKITLKSDITSPPHTIKNGTWDSMDTQKPKTETDAPKVDDLQINGGDSKPVGPFTTAGTFHLYCTLHPGMNLTVIVK
jgi:plastocyanin